MSNVSMMNSSRNCDEIFSFAKGMKRNEDGERREINRITKSLVRSFYWMKRALINVGYFSFFLKRGKREIRRGKRKTKYDFMLSLFLHSLIFVVNQLSLGLAIRLWSFPPRRRISYSCFPSATTLRVDLRTLLLVLFSSLVMSCVQRDECFLQRDKMYFN